MGAVTTYPAGLLVSAGVLIGQSWSLATAVILAGAIVVGHVAGWWLPYAGVASARSATSTGRSTPGP